MAIEPTPEEWRHLYEAALTFRDLAPWRWMEDVDWFAVKDPETGTIGYCVVLGAAGEVFGLGVYPGPDGWASLDRISRPDIPWDVEDVMFGQTALVLSFGGRDDLTDRDRAVIRHLGLRLRGKHAWPLFRSHRPGMHPWYLSGEEARFLATVLEQTIVVAGAFRENPALLHAPAEDYIMTRIQRLDTGEWTDAWTTVPEVREDVEPPGPVNEVRAARLRRVVPKSGVWAVDVRYSPVGIEADERLVHPLMMMCADVESGTVLGAPLAEGPDERRDLIDSLLGMMESAKVIPEQVIVRKPATQRLLSALAKQLDIKIVLASEFPLLEYLWDSLVSGMSKGGFA